MSVRVDRAASEQNSRDGERGSRVVTHFSSTIFSYGPQC